MLQLSYPATFLPEARGYFTVLFPDLPEAITSGHHLPNALASAADCLGVALAGRIADGKDIPPASPLRKGHRLVEVPLYLAPKVALYCAMREQAMNNSELARLLGVSETVVRRLLNPNHDSKPEKVLDALTALGKRLIITVDDAA